MGLVKRALIAVACLVVLLTVHAAILGTMLGIDFHTVAFGEHR